MHPINDPTLRPGHSKPVPQLQTTASRFAPSNFGEARSHARTPPPSRHLHATIRSTSEVPTLRFRFPAPMRVGNDALSRRCCFRRKSFRSHSAGGGFFFGKQFHYPLYAEKARIGPEAAAGPVSNSREEYPNRCWPTLRFHYGPRPGAIRTPSGHAEHSAPLLV